MNEKIKKTGSLGGAAITIRLMPRASKNQIKSIMDDGTVKIQVTAPPVEGKANKALIRFLSEVTGLPESQIEIVAGLTGHNKLVTFTGINSKDLQEKILASVDK